MEGLFASIDILDSAIFGFVCLLLFIYVVSYWFQLKYREVISNEFFCPNMKCNVAFINSRLKAIAVSINFLSTRMAEINKALPYDTFVKQIEGFKGAYSNLNMIEKKINSIRKRQDTIIRYIMSKNPKFRITAKPRQDIDCFQIASSDDCSTAETSKQIAQMKSKLEELEYQTDLYNRIIIQIEASNVEYNKARDQAINKSSKLANQQMSALVGSNVNIDLNDHLKNGVSPDLERAIKEGDNRAIQENILNDPNARKFAANVKPAEFTKNAQNIYRTQGPNAGEGYKPIGKDLVSSRIAQSDRPNAQADFNDELKKQDLLPSKFVSLGN